LIKFDELKLSMRLNPFLVIICSFLFSSTAESQVPRSIARSDSDTVSPGAGTVVIIQDSRIDTVVRRHIEYNLSHKGIDGYRIQIFYDAGNNSHLRATKVAEEYQLLYPGDTAYVLFHEPNYKVRIGDFRTRLDAEGVLQDVISDYPNAFVIQDRINFPKLR